MRNRLSADYRPALTEAERAVFRERGRRGRQVSAEVRAERAARATAKVDVALLRRASDQERAVYQLNGWLRPGLPDPTRAPSRCECCGKTTQENEKALALDHDHTTGEFRGWLCSACNMAIGSLGDNIESLQRALDYLKRAKMNRPVDEAPQEPAGAQPITEEVISV